ncbi:unnamed protein product, partial [Rotaria sordida]
MSQSNATDIWSQRSQAMFLTAISLANRYNIKLNNQAISGDIIGTNNDENGHAVLNRVCHYISTQRSNIVGIVGPATSNNARFISPFAAHIKLPVVSYSATHVDFSDTHRYPKFYRIVPSDFFLAHAIVQLFKEFNWTTCTIIIQKDDYGYGGLNILSEHYNRNITIKERLTFDGEEFNDNLKKTLLRSRSKIVLVWAGNKETTSIVERALKEGVIGAPYVWITTDEVTLDALLLNISESNHILNKLEGLLTVMPIEVISSNNDFQQWNVDNILYNDTLSVWHNLWDENNREEYSHFHNISSFAIFTFDATWTLINALNRTVYDGQSSIPWFSSSSYCFNSSLENADQYHKHLKETNFLGISGPISFSNTSNDRVGGAYYVLKNLQLNENKHYLIYKHIMKWFNDSIDKNEKWRNFTGQQIVWPNRSEKIPVDYPQVRGDALSLEYTVDRQYCGRLLVTGVGFAKSSFGIVMPKDWQYKADFDVNILLSREE